MRVTVWHNEKTREIVLAEAIMEGLKTTGDKGEMRLLTSKKEVADADVAFMCGTKAMDLWDIHQRAGVHTIMLDKGYNRIRGPARAWKYWRVAVDAHNAADYIGKAKHPSDRWDEQDIQLKPWRDRGNHIVFAGSSLKYHKFHDLKHPTDYARKIIKQIRKATGRSVVYRPKPSWHQAVPIEHARFSKSPENITRALRGAHALVTHGSNACYEAILEGIPCVILGDGIAKSISSTSIADLNNPLMVNNKTRKRWASNLAYCQWTVAEFADGSAWQVIKPQIFG